jgi:hypothetical protein
MKAIILLLGKAPVESESCAVMKMSRVRVSWRLNTQKGVREGAQIGEA